MRVVVAGFGPFPGAPFNPSALVAKALARRRRPALADLTVTPHVFATAYSAVDRDLAKLFATKPDILLMFGLAAKRRHLCVETRAKNAVSLLFPDAAGYRPRAGVIAARQPAWQRGNAPAARLVHAARSRGVPSRASRDAGRYLCNYAYWQALARAAPIPALVAFVHIPDTRPKNKKPVASLPALERAAEEILIALKSARRAFKARPSS